MTRILADPANCRRAHIGNERRRNSPDWESPHEGSRSLKTPKADATDETEWPGMVQSAWTWTWMWALSLLGVFKYESRSDRPFPHK